MASLVLYWKARSTSEHHESAMRRYQSFRAHIEQRTFALEEARESRELKALARATAERRVQLEYWVRRAAMFLGRLTQTTDTDELIRRVGWLKGIEEQVDSFVGLESGRYADEIRELADALHEFRTETAATLRASEPSTTEIAGDPDKLTRLLERCEEALLRLYSATSDEPYEQLRRGIPK